MVYIPNTVIIIYPKNYQIAFKQNIKIKIRLFNKQSGLSFHLYSYLTCINTFWLCFHRLISKVNIISKPDKIIHSYVRIWVVYDEAINNTLNHTHIQR